MNKKNLPIIIICVLFINFIFASTVAAKIDVQSLLTNSPSQVDYPEAGGIILKDETTADFTGSKYKLRRKAIIKVFNKRGIKKFGEVKIKFNKKRENVKILKAKTIKPNGEVVKATGDAINEITPPELSEANIYSNVRQKVISMPALEPGAIIICEYIKEVKKPVIKDEFWFKKYFQRTEPVKESSLIVKTSADKQINHREKSMNLEPDITQKDGSKTYIWRKKDVPAIIKESAMLPIQDIASAVTISSLDSWSEFAGWYDSLINDQYRLNRKVKQKIKELTKEAVNRQEKIKALYNYVALNIRYVGLEFGIGGYKPHTAVEIYNKKYGDCKDKAILLLAMLKEIGVKAEPVLINAKWHPELKIVSPEQFNHMILYLPGQELYLDPTSEVTRYGNLPVQDQGKQVLLPVSKKIEKTPVQPANNNQEIIKQQVKLNKDGSAGIKVHWKDKGYYDSVFKKLFRKYTSRQQGLILKQIINKSFPNARMIDYQLQGIEGLDHRVQIDISMQGNNYARNMGSMFTIQPIRFPINLSKLAGAKERKYPLYFGTTLNLIRKIKIELPGGLVINHLPQDVRIKNKVGSLDLDYKQQDNKIIVNFAVQIKKAKVKVSDYQLVRDLFNKVGAVSKNQILLTKEN